MHQITFQIRSVDLALIYIFWFCCHWICLSGLVIVFSVYSFQIWPFQAVLLKNQKHNFVFSQQSWLLRFCLFVLRAVTPLQWAGELCIWQLGSLCHSWDQMVWAECWSTTPPIPHWYLQIYIQELSILSRLMPGMPMECLEMISHITKEQVRNFLKPNQHSKNNTTTIYQKVFMFMCDCIMFFKYTLSRFSDHIFASSQSLWKLRWHGYV